MLVWEIILNNAVIGIHPVLLQHRGLREMDFCFFISTGISRTFWVLQFGYSSRCAPLKSMTISSMCTRSPCSSACCVGDAAICTGCTGSSPSLLMLRYETDAVIQGRKKGASNNDSQVLGNTQQQLLREGNFIRRRTEARDRL